MQIELFLKELDENEKQKVVILNTNENSNSFNYAHGSTSKWSTNNLYINFFYSSNTNEIFNIFQQYFMYTKELETTETELELPFTRIILKDNRYINEELDNQQITLFDSEEKGVFFQSAEYREATATPIEKITPQDYIKYSIVLSYNPKRV